MRQTKEVTVAKRENRSHTDANERIALAGQVHQASIGIAYEQQSRAIGRIMEVVQ